MAEIVCKAIQFDAIQFDAIDWQDMDEESGAAAPSTPATTPEIEILDRAGDTILDRAGDTIIAR